MAYFAINQPVLHKFASTSGLRLDSCLPWKGWESTRLSTQWLSLLKALIFAFTGEGEGSLGRAEESNASRHAQQS